MGSTGVVSVVHDAKPYRAGSPACSRAASPRPRLAVLGPKPLDTQWVPSRVFIFGRRAGTSSEALEIKETVDSSGDSVWDDTRPAQIRVSGFSSSRLSGGEPNERRMPVANLY